MQLVPDLPALCLQETEEDDDDDESSNSSESGESSTPAPTTETAVVVTEELTAETTTEPIEPTIVTDTETARGDNFGGYPGDYKSIVFVEDKSYHKIPVPYKSYEYIGKSAGYDMKYDNEVEKSQQMYKSQVSVSFLNILHQYTPKTIQFSVFYSMCSFK